MHGKARSGWRDREFGSGLHWAGVPSGVLLDPRVERQDFRVPVSVAPGEAPVVDLAGALRGNDLAATPLEGVDDDLARVLCVVRGRRHERGESRRVRLYLRWAEETVQDRGADVAPATVVRNLHERQFLQRQPHATA